MRVKTFIASLVLGLGLVSPALAQQIVNCAIQVNQNVTVQSLACTPAPVNSFNTSFTATVQNPVPVISISLTPTSVQLQVSQQQSFSAHVTGSTQGVTWSLVGAIGTVDSNGLFIAGGVGTGTVTATSVQDPTKSASASITIVPNTTPTGFDGPAELPRVLLVTTKASEPTPGKITSVPTGGLQAALNAAQCGDVLQLTAGSVHSGTFIVPAKACDDAHWIQIRTSAPDWALPVEGKRLLPCSAGVASLPGRPPFTCVTNTNVTAKIIEPQGNTSGPLVFANGANHYRLGPGLEITRASGTAIVYSLISGLGSADKITADRIWLHGSAQDETKNGISWNGFTNSALIDSYATDMHCTSSVGTCTDAKVIGAGVSNLPGGPYRITNNFLEASGENILFGGGPATTTPTDTEIRYNHFFKPLIWLKGQPGFVGGPGGQPFMVKNLLEIKNGIRTLVEGNIFEYSWGGYSQPGYMILIAPKNQQSGCPTCQVTDYVFRYNTMAHAGGGFQIESVPDDNGAIGKDGERYSIHDVTITDINKVFYAASPGASNGVLFQVISGWPAGQIQHLWINHITGFPDPNGKIFAISNKTTNPQMTDFKVQNSIFGQALYPVWSSSGSPTDCALSLVPLPILNTCFNPYVWMDNAMIAVNQQEYPSTKWPTSSFFPSTIAAVGFNNYPSDLSLASTSSYKNKGSDGKDLGADTKAINAAINGVY